MSELFIKTREIIFMFFLIILFLGSTAYFSMECDKLEEKIQVQIELKDAQIMELQTKNADYSRIHKWIPILEQLLTPLARHELDAVAEKLIQEKEKNHGS